VENVLPRVGLGRVGTLSPPSSVAALAGRAAETFGLSACPWSGDGRRMVDRVGVLPGGGRGLVDEAAGVCQVLITGDLGYHDAERAGEAGLSLIEAPHGELEWWAFRRWGKSLERELSGSGVTVSASEEWRSPWQVAGSVAGETGRGVRLWIDGGSRGNPGRSAIGVILEDESGEVLDSVSRVIGVTTNNVAEYRALITGLEMAGRAGAREVDVLSDSELLVKHIRGEYRLRSENLRALHEEAKRLMAGFEHVSLRHVGRGQNARADALVNQALDQASPA